VGVAPNHSFVPDQERQMPERPPPLAPPHKGEGKKGYRLTRSEFRNARLWSYTLNESIKRHAVAADGYCGDYDEHEAEGGGFGGDLIGACAF